MGWQSREAILLLWWKKEFDWKQLIDVAAWCWNMEHSAVPATEWNRAMHFGLSSYLTFAPPLPPRAASLFWGPLHSNGVLRPDAGCHLLAKSSLWWFLFLFPGGCSHRRTNLGCSLLCVVLTPTASSKAFSLTVTCLQFCFQIRSQLYHYLSCSQIFCPYYWTIIYPLKENHSKRTLLCST